MEHTQIVTASDLEAFAETRAAEEVIPELVWLLVTQSVQDLTTCRIPYGDAINQPGLDGVVETATGFRQFVPQDISFWEIGCGANPQDKATEDYKKRTNNISAEERSGATYVFVTPRCAGSGGWPLPAQEKWLERRRGDGWADIKVIDGVQLADWMRDFPAVGRWILKKIGHVKAGAGFETPAEHWELLKSLSLPPLSPKVFLAGRESGCDTLRRLLGGEISELIFAIENELDAEDFVAAFLESLDPETRHTFANRCLFISDPEVWYSMANLRARHILVAHPRLDLEYGGEKLHMVARQRSHGIVMAISGRSTQGSSSFVHLRSPSKSVLEQVLLESGFEPSRARELAGAGAMNLAGLKRHLRGLGELPPYADWDSARLLAQAGLLGRWAGTNEADQKAAEILLGKSYGEWIEAVHPEALRPDAPLSHLNNSWKIVSRGEAWGALGPRLVDDDLDRFKKAALMVLSEQDPRFELPPDAHYLASTKGKVLMHSSSLRSGVAETLALLGSRSDALTFCSQGKAEITAHVVVRELLLNAPWQRWASLNQHLPMLAEAAPNAFLDCVDNALAQPGESPFVQVFAQESNAFGGGTYISGLLWALETLAWHPDYLARVTLLLGELAAVDPGGKWTNRPANTLKDIFLPWYPQTCAPIEKRKAAISALLREQPLVGWRLLIALMPRMHETSSGSAKPTWRTSLDVGWMSEVSASDYWRQVEIYADLATQLAAADLNKLTELIDRLPDLPPPATARVLQHLASDAVVKLSEAARQPLWEALIDLVSKHRKFANAEWSMDAEKIAQLETVAERLAPESISLLHRRLFSERDIDLLGEIDNYEEQLRKLEGRRQAAIKEILVRNKAAGILEFAEQVDSPGRVGYALGFVKEISVDEFLFPSYLDRDERYIRLLLDGFVSGRFNAFGWTWADSLLSLPWTPEQKNNLLVRLPFLPETWGRAEKLLPESGKAYWRKVSVTPWGLPQETLTVPAQRLLEFDRPKAAIECLSILARHKAEFPPELAIQALMGSLRACDNPADRLSQYRVEELIEWLQDNESADINQLCEVEWAYLPMLDRFREGRAKALESRLASDPEFYCQAIRAVFRSENERDTKREVTPQEKNIADNAYRLLHGWKILPGSGRDGSFDGQAFTVWLGEVKRLTSESGHYRIAMSQLGQVLSNSPSDPDGLWIHSAIASSLDAKDADAMRSGLSTGLFNQRGVFTYTAGEQELKLALAYREKAEALDCWGYPRLADTIRKLAEQYERDAEREAKRSPFDD